MRTPDVDRLVLVLEFDGVLHPLARPTADGRGRPYTGPLLVHGPLLAKVLAPWVDRIDIVTSPTWAKRGSLEAIRALLPEELTAPVGARGLPEGRAVQHEDASATTRYRS